MNTNLFKAMTVRAAYNQWSEQYDTNNNRTRDLEAIALRDMLHRKKFRHIIEIGCGTGKNSVWLKDQCEKLTAIDLSEGMLEKARQKVTDIHVVFRQADILEDWNFTDEPASLITFSLILEHIEHLGPIFRKAAGLLDNNGLVYVGELHPYKQYAGSKARFETPEGTQVVSCFNHHLTDFTEAAAVAGLRPRMIREFFDDDQAGAPPRLLCFLFERWQ